MSTESVQDRLFVQSSRRMGVRMALVSALMVLVGATLFFVVLWWKATVEPATDAEPHDLNVGLDLVDVVVAVIVLGVATVALAGISAVFFARQATRPLAEAMQRQHNFIADASHELRTPITVMHLRVQQLQALSLHDEQLHAIATELRNDTTEMASIVSELLDLATLTHVPGAHCELAPVLEEVASEQGALAAQHDISVSVDSTQATVALAETTLHRCLSALVSNSVSHTPAGGSVTMSARKLRRSVEVRIADTGPGITGIDPSQVFDRFSHGAPGRDPSHGIGLALVRDAVTRAGGDVRVERTGPDGTVFLMTLKEA